MNSATRGGSCGKHDIMKSGVRRFSGSWFNPRPKRCTGLGVVSDSWVEIDRDPAEALSVYSERVSMGMDFTC